MHFVLSGFKRYAGYDAGCLDTFGRSRFAVAGNETVVEDIVERMLYASEAFGRVVVFVVNMDIVVAYGIAGFRCEEIVVYEGFCGFAREFHHHSRGRVGIHVGILAGDIVVLCLDDFMEHVAGFGLACYAALVAIGDIAFGDFLAGAVHEFKLDHILNVFHGHAFVAFGSDTVCYFLYQRLVFTKLGCKHGLADGCLDFFLIVTHDTTVAFDYYLYHRILWIYILFDILKEPRKALSNNNAKL